MLGLQYTWADSRDTLNRRVAKRWDMISAARMAAVDRNAEALGVPRRQLMESSGNAIARTVREAIDPGGSVSIVCGRGNNGGDGFVAARFLSEYDVRVRLLGRADRITTDIARANWEAIAAAELDVAEWRDSTAIDVGDVDVVVDALVGTGIQGSLREPLASAVEAINRADAWTLSVDTPSGIDVDSGAPTGPAVDADAVVTFHDQKPGLEGLDAPVTVADIGIPDAAERFVGPGDLQSIDRDSASHKGDAGRILVVGGGPYTGAPALCALAALRCGADLGVVACPASVAPSIEGYGPDLIVRDVHGDRVIDAHVDRLLELAGRADSVVVGPGLGDDERTLEAVASFLQRIEKPCVVDADALAAVPDVPEDRALLCTPHQGELERMGGPRAVNWRERASAVADYADTLGHTLLVKGPYDVISDGATTRINRTGNPGMTVGGTGDVLAGACAAMIAEADRSACQAGAMAAYVTGAAGDRVADTKGYGLIASDVIDALPDVLRGEAHA